jgi:starch-binding outer membrane protein, SusD/RagB family
MRKYIKKNVIILLAVILLVIAGTACKKWFVIVPDDGIYSQSYWKDRSDLEGALAGCYSAFSRSVSKIFVLSEIRTDMLVEGSKSNGDMFKLKEGRIANSNSFVGWSEFYYTINLCNTVIKNGPKVLQSDLSISPAEVRSLLAEAYYLRSLTYFYLVRLYKEVPLILDPYENNEQTFNVPKSSEQAILSQITTDLETNQSYAVNEFTSSTFINAATTDDFYRAYYNKGRVTKYAYWALMADVYLWTNENQKCVDACDSIINSGSFQLLTDTRVQDSDGAYGTNSWFQNFYSTLYNFDEHIFTILYLANTGSNNVARYLSPDGEFNLVSNGSLLNDLYVNTNDVRGNAATYLSSGYNVWKWVGTTEGNSTLRRAIGSINTNTSDQQNPNWIIYRLADVILMKAEAEGELGNLDLSNQLVNVIRRRAGAVIYDDPAADIQANEDRVLLERQLELAFEGKRWFDLIRNAKRNNWARKSLVVEAALRSSTLVSQGTIAASVSDTLGMYYPIAKDELSKNSSLVQNPFYIH